MPDPDPPTSAAASAAGTDLLARLLARLDPDPGVLAVAEGMGPGAVSAARVEALLGVLEPADSAEPGLAALKQVLTALLVRMQRDSLADRIALARAQFTTQHLRARRAPDPAPDDRLVAEAQALGQLYAQALEQLPRRKRAALFDAPAYLDLHPDVAAAGVDAASHYCRSGAKEGRLPTDLRRALPHAFAHAPTDMPALIAAGAAGMAPAFAPDLPAALRSDALAQIHRSRPRISVILPCWNRADLVPRAVASALTQSVAPHEILVIDDGSTDGSADRLGARFPEAVARGALRVLRRPHEGVSAARNAGLAAATGDIIAYLDSDNSWDPDHLLFACAGLFAARRSGSDTPQLAYTALNRHNLAEGWSDILWQPFDRTALEAANYIDLNAVVHVRALTEARGGFDPHLTRLVDWDLLLRLTRDTAPVAVPVVTVQYLLTPGLMPSITGDEDAAPNLARIRARLAPPEAPRETPE